MARKSYKELYEELLEENKTQATIIANLEREINILQDKIKTLNKINLNARNSFNINKSKIKYINGKYFYNNRAYNSISEILHN